MAVTIANSNPAPEYLESVLKSILVPAINFIGTLTRGPGPMTVQLVDQNDVVYGTFVLDTLNQRVETGLITNLPNQIRYKVVSGEGKFNILCVPGVA